MENILNVLAVLAVMGAFMLMWWDLRRQKKPSDAPAPPLALAPLPMTTYPPEPSAPATKADCPWYEQVGSYAKRHVAAMLLLPVIAGVLYASGWLQHLTFAAHDAPDLVLGGPDPDGAQVLAAHQAGGAKSLGSLVYLVLGTMMLFSAAITVVWFLMHYITPALPAWAKKHFSDGFKISDPTTPTLPLVWQYAVQYAFWFGLLFIFALCGLAVSNNVG